MFKDLFRKPKISEVWEREKRHPWDEPDQVLVMDVKKGWVLWRFIRRNGHIAQTKDILFENQIYEFKFKFKRVGLQKENS